MEKNNNKIDVKLLTDDATSIDEFNHSKISDSIGKIILNEDFGKSMALTGTWGSGKSSIVSMLKTTLKDDCKVFIFDAWAHEGDPLRRTFLESLINYLNSINWVTTKYKDEKIEYLAKRKEVIDITNDFKPTKQGILFAILSLLIPPSLGVLGLFDEIFIKWPDTAWLILLIAFLISMSPFLMVLIYFIKDKKKLITFFVQEVDKTTTTTSYRTTDPTSIEFQNTFIEFLTEAYKTKKKEKFLIVIDNLDRIDTEDALKIWSTMKTFFDLRTSDNDSWKKDLWLLVPFDFSGINKCWRNDRNDKAEHDALVNSFTDKTFQVKFEAPPIIFTNWEKYFKSRFDEAFFKFKDKEEIHKIYRIFRLLRKPKDSIPTPREIKLFINDIIPFYINWDTRIPLHVQALYVMLRKTIWRDESKIITNLLEQNNFISPVNPDMINSEYKEFLASLYFNVDRNTAVQLLITNQVENSLIENNINNLDILKTYSGFTNICEDVIYKNYNDWAKEDPNKIGVIADSLEKIELDNTDSLNGCWLMLKRSIESTISWTNFTDVQINGLIILITKFKDDSKFTSSLLKDIGNSFSLFELKLDDTFSYREETTVLKNLEYLCKLFNTYVVLGKENELLDYYRIKIRASTYNSVMYLLSKQDNIKRYYKYFIPANDPNDIVKDLGAKVDDKFFSDYEWGNVIKLYNKLKVNWNWDELTRHINDRFTVESKSQSAEIGNLVQVLFEINNYNNESN